MAAPTITARGTPAGIMLENSFPVKISFTSLPTVSFWEKTIQGSGYDNGDGIDITTQFNTAFRTFAPRALQTVTSMKGKAAYDPNVFEQIKSLIGRRDSITKSFADGSTISVFGYLKSFIPSEEAGDGTQPEADFEIMVTNWDPVNHVEAAPLITSVSGT